MIEYARWMTAGTVIAFLALAGCEAPDEEEVATNGEAKDEAVEDCALTMGWDPWEPYHYLDPQGEVAGLDVELVQAATDKLGCELSYEQADFAELLRMLREGDVDLVPGATVSEAREEFARFSVPYRDEEVHIWVRAGDHELLEDADLETLLESERRIGITEGFLYGDDAESLLNDSQYAELLVNARLTDINLMRLVDHEVDAVLADPYVVHTIQRRLGLSGQMAALETPVSQGEVSLMFSRASVDEELLEKFNDALKTLQEDGTQERILKNYQTP